MLAVEVLVAGAGPAGASAATWLARAGREVLLVDKARFPRDKTCGDGLTTGALRALERLGFDPSLLPSWQAVDDVVVRSPSGRQAVFPLPQGRGLYAAVVPRLELDSALVDLARAAGVKVADGHGVRGVGAVRDDRAVLDVDGIGEVAARYVVAADGMWSPLRRMVGAADDGYLGEWHAFRQYASGVTGPAARELFVWFEPDLLPGYAWSFPLPDGRANVGFGIQRGGKVATQEMKALWPALLERPHVAEALGPGARLEGVHRAWPIPARVESAVLSAAGGRVLFVGDAASATDPLTGEGIGQALLTGEWAAQAIAAAGALRPAAASAAYAASVRRELVPDAWMSRLLIRAVRHRKGVRAAIRIAGTSAWTRRNFGRWLFEDYPRAFVVTPGRWREHSFTGDGAYRRQPPGEA
jgi:geranylgeranyl reductase family protein